LQHIERRFINRFRFSKDVDARALEQFYVLEGAQAVVIHKLVTSPALPFALAELQEVDGRNRVVVVREVVRRIYGVHEQSFGPEQAARFLQDV
jgi:hypothetical protein